MSSTEQNQESERNSLPEPDNKEENSPDDGHRLISLENDEKLKEEHKPKVMQLLPSDIELSDHEKEDEKQPIKEEDQVPKSEREANEEKPFDINGEKFLRALGSKVKQLHLTKIFLADNVGFTDALEQVASSDDGIQSLGYQNLLTSPGKITPSDLSVKISPFSFTESEKKGKNKSASSDVEPQKDFLSPVMSPVSTPHNSDKDDIEKQKFLRNSKSHLKTKVHETKIFLADNILFDPDLENDPEAKEKESETKEPAKPNPTPKKHSWTNFFNPDYPEGGGSRLRCLFFYLYTFLGYGLLIYLIYFTMKEKAFKLSEFVGAMDYLSYNVAKDPILDIKFSVDGTCPENYTIMTLGKWVGTMEGCYCPETDIMYAGRCDDKMPKTCKGYQELLPRDFYNWEVNSAYLCHKRAILNKDYVKKANCTSGFTECYPGFCFDSTVGCPITNITMTNKKDSPRRFVFGSRYMNIFTNVSEQPVIDLQIAYNLIPCFDMDNYPPFAKTPYVLWRNSSKVNGCGRYGIDLNSALLDTTRETYLYLVNKWTEDPLQLPHFREYSDNITMVLSERKQVKINPIKEECYGIDTRYMNMAFEADQSITLTLKVVSFACLVFHTIAFVLVITATFIQVRCFKIFEGFDLEPCWGFFFTLELCFWAACAILLFLFSIDLKESLAYFSNIADCHVSKQPKLIINDFISFTENDNFKDQILIYALLGLSSVCYPVLGVRSFSRFVKLCCKKKKNRTKK